MGTSVPPYASAHGNLAHLLPPEFKRTIASWLHEDCPSFDYGGFVVGEETKTARLYAKSVVSDFQEEEKKKKNEY